MAYGKFCWNELNTRNLERVKTFYAGTLGWSYDATPEPGGAAIGWITPIEKAGS